MTKKEIATLSFKVLSIYAFIRAIDKLPNILYFIFKIDLSELSIVNLLMTALPPLLLALCAVLLWYMAPLLASLIFKLTVPEDKSDASLANIQMIAFSVVGLFLLASALPDLVNSAVMHYTIVTHSTSDGSLLVGTVIVLILKIILGLWLLLGSRGLVKFIRSTQRD